MFSLKSLRGEPVPALRPWAGKPWSWEVPEDAFGCCWAFPATRAVGRVRAGHAPGHRTAGGQYELPAGRIAHEVQLRRWVALPGRPAQDLLRPGRNSGRCRGDTRSGSGSATPAALAAEPLSRGALCPP